MQSIPAPHHPHSCHKIKEEQVAKKSHDYASKHLQRACRLADGAPQTSPGAWKPHVIKILESMSTAPPSRLFPSHTSPTAQPSTLNLKPKCQPISTANLFNPLHLIQVVQQRVNQPFTVLLIVKSVCSLQKVGYHRGGEDLSSALGY